MSTTQVPEGCEKVALLWQVLFDPEFQKRVCKCQAVSVSVFDCPVHGEMMRARRDAARA